MDEVKGIPDKEKRILSGNTVLVIMLGVLAAAIICSVAIGRYAVSFRELYGILIGRHFGMESVWSKSQEIAVLNVRLPRIILGVIVGAGLSAAGAAYQGVFQNPMAAPDVLGASAGAGFGAAFAIFLGMNSTGVTAMAFAMSLVTVMLVFSISRYTKGERVMGLVLAGMVISSLFQAGTSFIKLVVDPNDKLPAITYWLMGSLVGSTKKDLFFALVPMFAGMTLLMLMRWRLNVLTLGDDEARALGVDAGKTRTLAVCCATLLTATAVSVSGMIGWVGLVVPHMMRRLVGSNFKYLMPASILGGGLFMLVVDNISRSVSTTEIPIGILTAFVGAPFFVVLITRRGD